MLWTKRDVFESATIPYMIIINVCFNIYCILNIIVMWMMTEKEREGERERVCLWLSVFIVDGFIRNLLGGGLGGGFWFRFFSDFIT